MKNNKRFFFLEVFLLCVIFISCRTSPTSQGFVLFPQRFETIETFSPTWEFFAAGIEYAKGIIKSPQMEFYGLKVDLQNANVKIIVNDPAQTIGIIPSIKPSSFAENYGCIAVINANPFNTSSANEGIPLTVVGIAVSNGVLISRPHENYAALVFYKSGKPEILWQKDLESVDDIENAVGGFFMILKDGQFQDDVSDFRKSVRNPQSAAGLSSDGRFLYLLAVDGRLPFSVGATEKETAQILQQFGAQDALIFDGGGSSSLVLKYPDEKFRTANTPVHMGIRGYERAAATCLGIKGIIP